MSKTLHMVVVAATLVTLAIGIASGPAAARNFSFEYSENLVSERNITMTGRNERGETVTLIECPMTLSMRTEPGIFESEGGRVGTARISNVGRCSIGINFAFLNNPAIVGNLLLTTAGMGNEGITGYLVTQANAEFLIDDGTHRCLYRGTLNFLIAWLWRPGLQNWTESSLSILPFTAAATTQLAGSATCLTGTFNFFGSFVPVSPRTWYP